MTLPKPALPVAISALGLSSVQAGRHTVTALLVDQEGKTRAEQQQDLPKGGRLILDTFGGLRPGRYTLSVRINSVSGVLCSESRQVLEALAGPFLSSP